MNNTQFRKMMLCLLDDECGITYEAWGELNQLAQDLKVPIIDFQRKVRVVEGRVFLQHRVIKHA